MQEYITKTSSELIPFDEIDALVPFQFDTNIGIDLSGIFVKSATEYKTAYSLLDAAKILSFVLSDTSKIFVKKVSFLTTSDTTAETQSFKGKVVQYGNNNINVGTVTGGILIGDYIEDT